MQCLSVYNYACSKVSDSIKNIKLRQLREFDDENVEIIIAEGISDEGLGLAIMNRLRKAAGYNIVKT